MSMSMLMLMLMLMLMSMSMSMSMLMLMLMLMQGEVDRLQRELEQSQLGAKTLEARIADLQKQLEAAKAAAEGGSA
eukprot:6723686-Pyramimonas_sp.AAC.1